MKADAKAVKRSEAASYQKCDDKLLLKFTKIEAKLGAACPTLDDRADLQIEVEACTTDLVCRTLEAQPVPASVLVLSGFQVSAGDGRSIKIQNLTAGDVEARCHYIPDMCEFDVVDFDVRLSALESVEWTLEDGLLTFANQIPAITIFDLPFFGDLVCVEGMDTDGFEPTSGNSLRASTRLPGECPVGILGLLGVGFNNGDPEIRFGTEYESCPPEIDPDVIQTCWSQAPTFDFFCD